MLENLLRQGKAVTFPISCSYRLGRNFCTCKVLNEPSDTFERKCRLLYALLLNAQFIRVAAKSVIQICAKEFSQYFGQVCRTLRNIHNVQQCLSSRILVEGSSWL